jgi:hypothetical protein
VLTVAVLHRNAALLILVAIVQTVPFRLVVAGPQPEILSVVTLG